MSTTLTDERILSLFHEVKPFGVSGRHWSALDDTEPPRLVFLRRLPGTAKGRVTEALAFRHTGIVPIRRWIGQDDAIYVLRDVIGGKNLRKTLEPFDGGYSPATLRKLLTPIADAVEAAHTIGLAHGGISPENILVDEEGVARLSDWGVCDSGASPHDTIYGGVPDAIGDVHALGKVVAAFLPRVGAFANEKLRTRVEDIASRCRTMGDLRETLKILDGTLTNVEEDDTEPDTDRSGVRLLPLGLEKRQNDKIPPPKASGARLHCVLRDRVPRVSQGGGGSTGMIVKNEGTEPLVVRMIATQHTWLNAPRLPLPLTLAPGEYRSLVFAISAARLTPGEYRTEVYFSANAPSAVSEAASTTDAAESLSGGWYKHTCELRLTVENGGY